MDLRGREMGVEESKPWLGGPYTKTSKLTAAGWH